MNKALSAPLALVFALGVVACGYAPPAASQAPSGPPDRVLDKFKAPDGQSDIYLFCRNGDYYVFMNGYKQGSINQSHNDERCK